jgi:Tfp pilus assembly protein PilV
VFGATATSDKEIAVLTRSMMQQMAIMASQTDVPAEDVAEGRATPGWEAVSAQSEAVVQSATAPVDTAVTNGVNAIRLIRIHCAKSQPQDAFVAIPYRSNWFWIDDRDLKSKRTFSFMMLLFTLADTGERENLPLITIPAQ